MDFQAFNKLFIHHAVFSLVRKNFQRRIVKLLVVRYRKYLLLGHRRKDRQVYLLRTLFI